MSSLIQGDKMLVKDILINQKNNNKIAIECGDNAISYKEIFNLVEMNCKCLSYMENQPKNIGIYLPNSIEYCIGYFTISLLDRVIVPIEIQAKHLQIENMIEYCELRLIITNSQYKTKLKNLLAGSSYKVTIFNLDDKTLEYIGKNEFVKISKGCSEEFEEDDVAIMLHTSGTTSNPKRVMLTHENLINNIKSNIEALKLNRNDKTLICLPMFFGYCNTSQFLTSFYLGASIVILDSIFIPEKFLKIVETKRCTNTTCVPSMLLLLLSFKNQNKYDISTLKYLCFGGGAMPIDKLRRLLVRYPSIGFIQTYGQTEASPRITCLMPEDSLRKLGSVGKAIPNVSVRIIDSKGEDVKIGEIGEIVVQGKNVMKGYYKRHEDTLKVKKNGWLYTGDLAKFDEEGYIYLTGRKKNVIISGGLNIYPEEIEEILMNHIKVKDVCVISESHDLLGEVPIAKVVLSDNVQSITEYELIKYCSEHLENHKVPCKITFFKELERTLTGKIKRSQVENIV